jgi:hypothetical protein
MTTPPIIANTDFTQWQNWERVTDPSGTTTYFVVPGYGGKYVFDPYASDATGRYTIYENPKPTYDAVEEQKRQQEEAGSTEAQIAPIVGAVTGLAATKLVSDAVADYDNSTIGKLFADEATKEAGEAVVQQGAATALKGGGQAAAEQTPEILAARARSAGQAKAAADVAAGVTEPTVEAGTAAATDATAQSGLETAGEYAGYAAMAYEAYMLYDGFANRDKKYQSDESQFADDAARVGVMVADGFTFGLASVADSLIQSTGAGQQFGEWLKAPIARKTGALRIADRLGGLQEEGVLVPGAQERLDDYQLGASLEDLAKREQENIDAGGRGNVEFALSRDEADLRPDDTVGGLMWFEELGNDYLQNATHAQRIEANKRALAEGLVTEQRGALTFKGDEGKARAKQIWADVLSEPEVPIVDNLKPVDTGGAEVSPAITRPLYQDGQPSQQGQGVAQTAFQPYDPNQPSQGLGDLGGMDQGQLPVGRTEPLPEYYEGAPQGQYRAPDGINTIMVGADGQTSQTLMGGGGFGENNSLSQRAVELGIGQPQQVPGTLEGRLSPGQSNAVGLDAISQILANKMDGAEPLGRGQQATITPPQGAYQPAPQQAPQQPPGGVGGPGYEPDPDRPGHFRRRF